MEPRGCNRWQSVANRACAKTAETTEESLPSVATACPNSSMVRRGRRFESVRGLRETPCKYPFALSSWQTAVTRGHSRGLADVRTDVACDYRNGLDQAVFEARPTPSLE